MKHFVREYSEFLRRPGVGMLVGVSLVARMPVGMVAFSMLMYLRERLGSFALAGTAVGIYFVAMAVAAPIQGRLIDRFGPRPTLRVTGVAHPLAMAAILLLALENAPFAAVATAAALCGAFSSPVIVITRTLWRHRFDGEEDRRRAFALDAVMIEANFAVGPALVATLLAVAGALAAFAFTIGAVVVAFVLFVASPALAHFKREAHAERHLLGPLTEPRLILVFLASMGLTTCFGLMEIGYPGYATALGMPAFGGALLAVNSIGSATGGAIYGGLRTRMSVERQFAAALVLMTLPLLAHLLLDAPAAWLCAAFVAGLFIAPCIAAQSVLVSRLAPSHYATEAFTWSSTFIVTGLGAGMALGGTLVEAGGVKSAFATAGALAFAMGLCVLLLPVRPPLRDAAPASR